MAVVSFIAWHIRRKVVRVIRARLGRPPDGRLEGVSLVLAWAISILAVASLAAFCWNVSCEPGRKKSCTKCVPGLPSFERSVITDWFAAIKSPPPGPPPKPPWFCCGDSVTVRSVPMPPSGSSVFFCARSSPFDRLAIAITSATPSPRPSSVTSVRQRCRSNSLRR